MHQNSGVPTGQQEEEEPEKKRRKKKYAEVVLESNLVEGAKQNHEHSKMFKVNMEVGPRRLVGGNADWMSHLPLELLDVPLWNLAIPGKHKLDS